MLINQVTDRLTVYGVRIINIVYEIMERIAIHSENSEVIGNNVYEYTFFGIELDSSGNSTLRNNSMTDNTYNFGVDGNSLHDFINDIDDSNTVNDKPIRYLINQHDFTIDSFTFQEMGYLGLVNSTSIRVQNLDVQDNVQGILFGFTTNSTISNVNASKNWNGVYVAHSSNISVIGSYANNNFDYGIKFFNSTRSLASGNNADNNGWAGIGIFRSPNSTVDGNKANFGTYNLHIVSTNNSVITRNSAAQSKPGGYSIALYYSHNNIIYHNMFTNSLLYVETKNKTLFIPPNGWDNSLEGNYWSNFRGTDANQDGIGDSAYTVGENNVDNYPLMGIFSDFNVTWEERTYNFAIISNSTISQFQFNPFNRTLSLSITDENVTRGFCRIAIPNVLLHDLEDSDLIVLINGRQPDLQNRWTDETYTYFYFTFSNSTPSLAIPGFLIAFILALVTALVFAIAILVKKHRTSASAGREKVPLTVVSMRLLPKTKSTQLH
jgi:parallel beta-helix repeat protein